MSEVDKRAIKRLILDYNKNSSGLEIVTEKIIALCKPDNSETQINPKKYKKLLDDMEANGISDGVVSGDFREPDTSDLIAEIDEWNEHSRWTNYKCTAELLKKCREALGD